MPSSQVSVTVKFQTVETLLLHVNVNSDAVVLSVNVVYVSIPVKEKQ